jgi:glycosyltransferase involved in cell wall biosynthesis
LAIARRVVEGGADVSAVFDQLRDEVAASGIATVRVLAWRDLDDPEAGGSEMHMDQIMSVWASAGLHVDVRTSSVPGRASRVRRHGYFVERKGGRYQVFPEAVWRGLRYDRHAYDALVEIWNGVPFFGPLWFKGPRLTLIHHVHSEMWQLTLPGMLGRLGWFVEHRLAPPLYRGGAVATLSRSSAEEITEMLGIKEPAVVPVGVSPFFSPGGERSPTPLVVAVGRLVPVKRFDLLIEKFASVRDRVPDARLVIAGEGYLRHDLEAVIERLGAGEWVDLPGRISDDELRDLYRSAWLVTSSSLREGWGMSITEAAACATPAVAIDIAGHRDAIHNGVSGLLVAEDQLAEQIADTLTNPARLEELREGALSFAQSLSWEATALALFRLLAAARR